MMERGTPRKRTPKKGELVIERAFEFPIHDISVLNERFEIVEQTTLTRREDRKSFKLPAGRYMVRSLAPNGRVLDNMVDLEEGERYILNFDTRDDPSPHEWLDRLNRRMQLPKLASIAGSSNQAAGLPSISLDRLKSVGAKSSISLRGYDGLEYELESDGVRQDLAFRIPSNGQLISRPKRREGGINIRSYTWSYEQKRWLRSSLIDEVNGFASTDFTHFEVQPDLYGASDRANKIHLIGAFQRNKPAQFISLPLFAEGVALTFGMAMPGERSDNEDTASFTWRLSALNPDVDGLLQALTGRGYRSRSVVSDAALEIADDALRAKGQDPIAAIVAAHFLLQRRNLDRRADWVQNLARRFHWSPDALLLGAWGQLLFGDGESKDVIKLLAGVFAAGPPQFTPSRRILRDLLSTYRNSETDETSLKHRKTLQGLWIRLGRENRRLIDTGPVYGFERNYFARRETSAAPEAAKT